MKLQQSVPNKKTCALLKPSLKEESKYKLEWLYKGEKVGAQLRVGNEKVLYISPELDYPIELITVRLLEFIAGVNIDVDNILISPKETDEESYFS